MPIMYSGAISPFFFEPSPSVLNEHDTRVEGGGVKVKKRKKRQKKLFKLSAMNQLVDENSFLKNKYDKLAQDGEDKLGYHWNEAVQTILFNKYVKPVETLMGRYLQIKRTLDTEGEGVQSKPKNPNTPEAPEPEVAADALAPEAAPEAVAPAGDAIDPEELVGPAPVVQEPTDGPVDTRITTESTDTMSVGNMQHSGPLVTTKGGMNSFMSKWKNKIKNDGSGMTIIEPNRQQHNMGQNAFKKLNESANLLAHPELMDLLFEDFDQETANQGNEEPTELMDTFVVGNGKIIANLDSQAPDFNTQLAQVMGQSASMKPEVVDQAQLQMDANDDNNWYKPGGGLVPGDDTVFEDEGNPIGHPEDLAHLGREKGNIAMDRVFNHPDNRQRDADFQKMHNGEPLLHSDAKHLTKDVSMNEGEKKPDALIQIERLHKETEKASNGYYKKEQKERGLDMKTDKDGGAVQQHDYMNDSIKPEDVKKRVPDAEEQEFVKLNRGGNLADRAIQGDPNMSKEFKDRMKDEAGADVVKDAENKAKEVEKVKPALAPPARVQSLKEGREGEDRAALMNEANGVILTARYNTPLKRDIIAFNTAKTIMAESVLPNFTLLETKGFGNDSVPGAKTIIESHNFYVDLAENQVYMLKKQAGALNEGVVEVNKKEYDRLRKLIAYSPSNWSGSR